MSNCRRSPTELGGVWGGTNEIINQSPQVKFTISGVLVLSHVAFNGPEYLKSSAGVSAGKQTTSGGISIQNLSSIMLILIEKACWCRV